MNNKPILYLMDKYTNDEHASLQRNQDAYLALVTKGYHPFSPICHSHTIEEYRKGKCDTSNCQKGGCELCAWDGIDYVAEDLVYLEGWMVDDADDYIHNGYMSLCNDCPQTEEYHDCEKWEYQKYDSGVVGVVLPSAIKSVKPCYFDNDTIKDSITSELILGQDLEAFNKLTCIECDHCPNIRYWDSNGAKQEYEFMKAHHILVITLETALTIPSDQWEAWGL